MKLYCTQGQESLSYQLFAVVIRFFCAVVFYGTVPFLLTAVLVLLGIIGLTLLLVAGFSYLLVHIFVQVIETLVGSSKQGKQGSMQAEGDYKSERARSVSVQKARVQRATQRFRLSSLNSSASLVCPGSILINKSFDSCKHQRNSYWQSLYSVFCFEFSLPIFYSFFLGRCPSVQSQCPCPALPCPALHPYYIFSACLSFI